MSEKSSVYSKIVSGELPAHIIYADELTCAFLDHNPLTKGHCLVVPKQQVDHLDDCSPELYRAVFKTVHTISMLLKDRFSPERIGIVVHGYEIPHAHVHVVPMYGKGDMQFPERTNHISSWQELKLVADSLKARA